MSVYINFHKNCKIFGEKILVKQTLSSKSKWAFSHKIYLFLIPLWCFDIDHKIQM